MLLARLIPKDSSNFKNLSFGFKKLGKKFDELGLIFLFPIWTLIGAGLVTSLDFSNRYVYWEWHGYLLGLIRVLVGSVIYIFILRPRNYWIPGCKKLQFKNLIAHFGIAILMLFIGWVDHNVRIINILTLFPYGIAFLSCLLIFQFELEFDSANGIWIHSGWQDKAKILLMSIFLMFVSTTLGILMDDPILSTAAAVSIPFPLVTLVWPNHVRHLQRARIFPIFTFAMLMSQVLLKVIFILKILLKSLVKKILL